MKLIKWIKSLFSRTKKKKEDTIYTGTTAVSGYSYEGFIAPNSTSNGGR